MNGCCFKLFSGGMVCYAARTSCYKRHHSLPCTDERYRKVRKLSQVPRLERGRALRLLQLPVGPHAELLHWPDSFSMEMKCTPHVERLLPALCWA